MLLKFPNVMFYMIAGNHDYYSPLEEFATYNVYNMLFTQEFLQIHKNLIIVNQDPFLTRKMQITLMNYFIIMINVNETIENMKRFIEYKKNI